MINKNKYLIISLLVTLVLAILPFISVYIISGGNYPKMPLEMIDDTSYYYARGVEISQGNIFTGNPYSVEHKNEISPAFFVADWMWSAPLVLGFPLQTSVIISQVLWFLIFGLILYFIFLFFELDKKYIPWSIAFVISFIYWYFARPVSMLVVFPIFLLWIICFINFLKDQKSRKNIIFLGFVTSWSIYVYTFLGQIILATLGVALFATFFKRFKIYKPIWFSAIIAGILSIPFAIYTWAQIHNPFYFETMTRIGLVNSHILTSGQLFYLAVLIPPFILVYLGRKKYSELELSVFFTISVGLILALISNIFTGKDMEITGHVGRFIELWSTLMFLVIIKKMWGDFREKIFYKFIVIIAYIFLISFSIIFQVRVWSGVNSNLLSNKVYLAPLTWLNENTPKDSVIFANDYISTQIPIMTEDYVLFSWYNFMYLVSDKEMQDRFLVSRVFQNLSFDDIKNNLRTYAGAGHSAHTPMAYNRPIKICRLLHFDIFVKDCGQFQTAYSMLGEKYFDDMQVQYDVYLKNQIETMKKYNISYVVVDKENDKWKIPKSLKLIWSDSRFEIYSIL